MRPVRRVAADRRPNTGRQLREYQELQDGLAERNTLTVYLGRADRLPPMARHVDSTPTIAGCCLIGGSADFVILSDPPILASAPLLLTHALQQRLTGERSRARLLQRRPTALVPMKDDCLRMD